MNQTLKNALIWILLVAVIVLGYFLAKKSHLDVPVTDLPLTPGDLPDDREEEVESRDLEARDEEINEENDVYKIEAVYPSFGEPNIDSDIKTFIQKEIATFKTNNSEPFPGQVAKYSFGATYKIVKSGEANSIIFNVETYSGGAHGNLFIKTFVYGKDGKRLSIGTFFKSGSNYLAKLSETSRAKLNEKSDDEWDESGTTPVSSNFDAFYISPEGDLNIIFQPYQVGPWVAGAPEISIDLENEMGDILAD